eukprot:COSAG04_NODE_1511_length_6492_cov_2.089786_4_plen_277_part_00
MAPKYPPQSPPLPSSSPPAPAVPTPVMAPPLALLLAAWVVAGADGGTATPPLPAAAVTVDWRGAPLAVTPMVATVHDVSAGASGNPHHDGRESVYPPTKYDIVDALAQRRRELASPLARLWWDTSVVMTFPDNRTTAWGPEPAPPNTTSLCAPLCPGCPCCPPGGWVEPDCYCCNIRENAGQHTSWNFSAMDTKVLRFQQAVVDPSSTVLQVTGNNPEAWWWRYVPTNDGPAIDPTGEQMGGYFSRVLDWYKAASPTSSACTTTRGTTSPSAIWRS